VANETSVATVRSPLSDLLVYPTLTQKNSKTKGCARVLTNAKSIAFLEEKERKMQKELELEEKCKKEREAKRLFRKERRSARHN